MFTRRPPGYATAVALALALAMACAETFAPAPVATVSLSPDTVTIEMRDTAQLQVVYRDSSGSVTTGPSSIWSSSDPTVATVSSQGRVIGVTAGNVWIRASAAGQTDSARVSVLVPVATLTITPTVAALVKGATVRISPVTRDSNGAVLFRRVTWIISDSARARVNDSVPCFTGRCAVVTALDSGSITVVAASGRQRAVLQLRQVIVRFASIAPDDNHTCALTLEGEPWCWGQNSTGQLAVQMVELNENTPGLVQGGIRFVSLAAGGDHTCAVTETQAAYCWGFGAGEGALGSANPPLGVPSLVTGSLAFSDARAGVGFSCGLAGNGSPYCWGRSPGEPQSFTPLPVSGGLPLRSLSVGGEASCGVAYANAAYCWGANQHGQLGSDSVPPTGGGLRRVDGGLTWASVSAGHSHSCGVTLAGTAYCWGDNSSGQLGTGDTVSVRAPALVVGGLTFTQISAGNGSTCGLVTGGVAYCWGNNGWGQLGRGTIDNLDHTAPEPVSGGLTFSSIATRGALACGISSAGLAYCWGNNFYGQLGIGNHTNAAVPMRVIGQQ